MKRTMFAIVAAVFTVVGCDTKVEADAERQAKLKEMYRVPPPSDPAEDKWSKRGSTLAKPKEQ